MSANLPNGVVPVGKLFAVVQGAANTVTEIIAPSVNLHGIIIRTLGISIFTSSGATGVNVYTDTAAPAASFDSTKRIVMQATEEASAADLMLPYQLYLYPGMGMWLGTSGNATVTVSYDLVD